jgi:hypothetical protein
LIDLPIILDPADFHPSSITVYLASARATEGRVCLSLRPARRLHWLTSNRLMIEGIDNDDMYRMVEDEFLAVAGEFTRHLHTAEYQRLKGLVKSKNAETIQNISRPVTGEMTDLVERRHAALDTAAKQRKGIAKALGKRAAGGEAWSVDEERPRRPATSLQGLMDSPRRQTTVLLTSVMGSRPGSSYRDAADASPSRRRLSAPDVRGVVRNSGINMSYRKDKVPSVRVDQDGTTDTKGTEDDDDDNLDGPSRLPSKPAIRRTVQATRPPAQQPSASRPPARARTEPVVASNPFLSSGSTRRQTFAQEASASTRRQVVAQEIPTDEHGDVPMGDEDVDFFSRLRARRAEQRRRRETKIKTQGNITKTSETQAAAINSIPFI